MEATAIQYARRNRTTFQYDNAGRLEAEIDPLARRMTYVYDKVGVRVDQKNRRTTYVYDDVSQETSRQYQDATRVTQTYDAAGRRCNC